MTVDAPTAVTAHPVALVVAGAAGRMGNRIVALAPETPGLRVVAALEAPGHAALGRDAGELAGVGRLGVVLGADAAAVLARDRVLVEFSVPAATLEHLRLVAAAGGRAVVGTTGFSAGERQEIADLGRRAAIMMAPNMSVAVTLAFKLLPLMAKALGDDYDIEITETHHRFKKDAPSGTALRMAEVIAEAPDAGQLAGVPPERGVSGRLQRGDHPQPRRLGGEGDDAAAHAAGGAGDHEGDGMGRRGGRRIDRHRRVEGVRWRGADAPGSTVIVAPLPGYLTSAYCRRIERSVSRLASLMRHIGSRNSGSSIPAMAIASLIGIGFVSRNAARASGNSR